MGKKNKLIVTSIPILAAIIVGIFGLFQGWFTPHAVPLFSQKSSGNQSPNFLAGRDINIRYGVPQIIVNALQNIITKNNHSVSNNDLKLNEMIENYKKLYSHLDRRSSKNSLLLKAKKKLVDADFEGTEALLLESLDSHIKSSNLSEASDDALEISYLKELELNPEEANKSLQFSIQLASDANTSENNQIPHGFNPPNRNTNITRDSDYRFVAQNPQRIINRKIKIENPDGEEYNIPSYSRWHTAFNHACVKVPISGTIEDPSAKVYVIVNQGYPAVAPGQRIYGYGPYWIYKPSADQHGKFEVQVCLVLFSGGEERNYGVKAIAYPEDKLKDLTPEEFEAKEDWPRAKWESQLIHIVRVDNNR